jgi:MFS transporter, putative metabolite:H+ symporter
MTEDKSRVTPAGTASSGEVAVDRDAGRGEPARPMARAFDEHRISKAAFIVALSAGLGYMFDAYVVNMFSFVLPLIKADFKASATTLGWVASILLFGYMIGTFLFGYLADKWGRKPALNLSIVTYALTNAAAGAMPGVASFAALRFMTGLGGAGEIAVGVPYTAEVYPTRKRAFGCGGLIFSLYGVGALIGLGVALGFAQQVGWRWTFYLSLVPAAFVLLLRRALTESERFQQAKQKHDAESAQEGGFARAQVGEILHTPELRRRLIIASMIFTANAVGYWGFLVFLQTYMITQFHLTFRHALAITMIFFGAMVVWPWIAAWLAERIGRRPTGVIGGVCLAAGSIIGFSTHSLGVFIAAQVFGIGMLGFTWSVGLTYVAELFPTRLRGTGFGLSVAIGRLPAIAGPVLTGTLISSVGLGTIAKIFAALWLLYIIGFIIGPETKGRQLEEI